MEEMIDSNLRERILQCAEFQAQGVEFHEATTISWLINELGPKAAEVILEVLGEVQLEKQRLEVQLQYLAYKEEGTES